LKNEGKEYCSLQMDTRAASQARRLAGDQAGRQARLSFEILAWPDPST